MTEILKVIRVPKLTSRASFGAKISEEIGEAKILLFKLNKKKILSPFNILRLCGYQTSP
jgi:hypothetical protein